MSQPGTKQPSKPVQPVMMPGRRHGRSRLRRWQKRLRRRFNWRILIVVIFSVIAVTAVGGLALTADSINRVNASVSNLNRIIRTVQARSGTDLSLNDFQRLQSSIGDFITNLDRARWQTVFLRPLMPLSADLAATFQVMEAASELARAADNVLAGLEPALYYMIASDTNRGAVAQISAEERLIEQLRIGRPRFLIARQHLDAASVHLDQLALDQISASLLLNILSVQRYHQQFSEINELLINAPDPLALALGLSQGQTYIILAQNNDELRPSGGYISTYGWMTVRNGRITGYDYSPTTATSPNPPTADSPYPVPDWWIRYNRPIYAAWDGSWYADFQRTAAMARWYYNTGNNPLSPVDGVIGIDITGFEYILGVLGEVTVPAYNVVVTKDNFRRLVYDIRSGGREEAAHKEFVAALYRQIFSQWQNLSRDPDKSADLLGAMLRALQEKHLMLSFTNEELNQAMQLLGWAGIQASPQGHDYLMAADANLGNKSNRSIIRQITYDAAIQADGRVSARTTIAYDYPRSLAENDPAVDPNFHGPLDYNSLLQIFAPPGSELIRAEASSTRRVEGDTPHTIFLAQVEIPYDSGERVQLAYVTPPLVEALGQYQRYRLLLQKQPGMMGELVNVQLSLPAGAEVISTTPEVSASYTLDRLILDFRLQLITDQWLEVIYRAPAA